MSQKSTTKIESESVITPVPGVPLPTEAFADAPNVVEDFEAELLANEELPLEDQPHGRGVQIPAPVSLSSADANTAAMLRVAESMERIVSRNESTRQLSYAEILPVTPFNPEGKRNRIGFKRQTYMHGILLNPMLHTEEEIDLFNQLKPGRYIDRKVEVQLTRSGELNLQWAGSKIDARMAIYTQFPEIKVMLKQIIAERAEKEAKRRRGVFDDEDDIT